MEINGYDLQCILNMGSENVELDNETVKNLIIELTRDQRFVDLVFESYEKIKRIK